MRTTIVFSPVMVDMKAHDTPPLFHRFEVQPQAKDLFSFLQRETDICFSVDLFKTDIFFRYRQNDISHLLNGIQFRNDVQFAQQIDLFRSSDRDIPYSRCLLLPFPLCLSFGRMITCAKENKRTNNCQVSSHITLFYMKGQEKQSLP